MSVASRMWPPDWQGRLRAVLVGIMLTMPVAAVVLVVMRSLSSAAVEIMLGTGMIALATIMFFPSPPGNGIPRVRALGIAVSGVAAVIKGFHDMNQQRISEWWIHIAQISGIILFAAGPRLQLWIRDRRERRSGTTGEWPIVQREVRE